MNEKTSEGNLLELFQALDTEKILAENLIDNSKIRTKIYGLAVEEYFPDVDDEMTKRIERYRDDSEEQLYDELRNIKLKYAELGFSMAIKYVMNKLIVAQQIKG